MTQARQNMRSNDSAVATPSDVAGWDANAQSRADELYSNNDPAYRSLINLVLAQMRTDTDTGSVSRRVLDIGCGVGVLTKSLSDAGCDVDAVDPSGSSIELAKSQFPSLSSHFSQSSLEDYVATHVSAMYDVLVANMTMHCVADLAAFFQSIVKVLDKDGRLIITMPNPRTYLQTREDIDLGGMDFGVPQDVIVPFRIRGHEPHPEPVRFYHRPIKTYSQYIDAVGLRIEDIFTPPQVGPGRSQDIAVMIVAWSKNQLV